MFKHVTPVLPGTQSVLDCAQQMMECTAKLFQSQLELTEKLYSNVSSECREMLTSSEPAALMQNLPKVAEKTFRVSTEGARGYLANGFNYQNEVMHVMEERMPEMNRQFIKGMVDSSKSPAMRQEG